MAGKQQEPELVQPALGEEEFEVEGLSRRWAFIDRLPTAEEVEKLLSELPDVWGVSPVRYIDFVLPMTNSQKVKVRRTRADGKGDVVEEARHDVTTLYFTVAGRQAMCREAQEVNGWGVDYEPEPLTPTGTPGFIALEPRVIYREYVAITARDGTLLGRKPGVAWSPAQGGTMAEGSSPYEVAETSARGRALGAWGFGILPGSGIASAEEMASISGNKRALDAAAKAEKQATPKRNKGEIVGEILDVLAQIQQVRDQDMEELQENTARYVERTFGEDIRETEGEGEAKVLKGLKWMSVLPGRLEITLNTLRKVLADEQSRRAKV